MVRGQQGRQGGVFKPSLTWETIHGLCWVPGGTP